jgi:exodeoxyribonuclease-3
VFSHPRFDMESRIVQAEVGDVVIASVYVPNGGKDYAAKLAFLEAMTGWSRELEDEGRQIVLCGDMNITRSEIDVHPKERKADAIGQRVEEREMFTDLLSDRLVDLGRTFDPDNPGLFTWWAPWRNLRARNIGWRLDYCLATQGVASRASGCVVLPNVGTSDHAPVVLTLD